MGSSIRLFSAVFLVLMLVNAIGQSSAMAKGPPWVAHPEMANGRPWVAHPEMANGRPWMEAEGRTCESQSNKFKGACVSRTNCANVCKTEGFPGGHCRGFRRRCFCTKHC